MEALMTFRQQVYDLVRQIPPGRVATYGLIAFLCGSPRGGRIVGAAMAHCPYEDVPCHRVVNRRGEMAPGNAFGEPGRQRKLLEKEGIIFRPDGRVELSVFGWAGPE